MSDQLVVPDRIGYDLGWRAFKIPAKLPERLDLEPPLRSMNLTEWRGREPMVARCRRNHDVPDQKCVCGIYIARTLPILLGMPERYHFYDGDRNGYYCAVGEVALWGPRIPATFGWRSAFAYPQRLLVPYEVWPHTDALQDIYGVKTIIFNFRAPKVQRIRRDKEVR